MNHSFLKTKQVFSKDEMEESEDFLLSYYFAHKVKKESKIIDADVEFNKNKERIKYGRKGKVFISKGGCRYGENIGNNSL